MTKPNFFIAGAQKSGTSTLYRMLKKHPGIFLSKEKELNFFNQSGITQEKFSKFLLNFSEATNQRYIGEATPHYYSSTAGDDVRSFTAEHIARFIGRDVSIVLILRNPVERAMAGWRHNYVYGRFDKYTSIFETPPSQGVLELSHYARHWNAWTKIFPEENFHVCLFDDLSTAPKSLLRELLMKLKLPFAETHYGDFPFERSTNRITTNMKNRHINILPGFRLDEIQRLVELFEPDITHVEYITGRNLNHWRDATEISKRFSEVVPP